MRESEVGSRRGSNEGLGGTFWRRRKEWRPEKKSELF